MTVTPAARRDAWLGIGRRQWADAWAGFRAIMPLIPGSGLFGLAFGALAAKLGYARWVATLGSTTVVAGASQIAILEQLRADAPAIIAIVTALVINARFALYSTALAPLWARFPKRWRFGLAYLMTDQSAVMSLVNADRYPDPVRHRWFSLGAALPFVVIWIIGTIAGAVLGPVIPEGWQIAFIVPLMFIAVMVPHLRTPPAVVAALVAVAVVVLAKELPFGLNVLLGALVGIAAGSLLPAPAAPNPEDAVAA